jgi:hypothetical protein
MNPADHMLGTRIGNFTADRWSSSTARRFGANPWHGSRSGLWYTLIVNLKRAKAQRAEHRTEAHCPRHRDD